MPERRKTIIAAGLLSAALCAASAGAAFAAGDADSAAQEKAPLTAPAVATPEAVSAQKWMNEGKPSAEVDLKALAAEQAAKGREAAPAEFDPQANPRLYEVSRQLRCLSARTRALRNRTRSSQSICAEKSRRRSKPAAPTRRSSPS